MKYILALFTTIGVICTVIGASGSASVRSGHRSFGNLHRRLDKDDAKSVRTVCSAKAMKLNFIKYTHVIFFSVKKQPVDTSAER